MDDDVPVWPVRSVLLSVRDLDRSTTFYQAVLHLREVLRQDRVAVLVGDERPPFTLFLRWAHPDAVHFGQEALGVRALPTMWGRSPNSNGSKRVFVLLTHLGTVEALRRLRATNGFAATTRTDFRCLFLAYESVKTVSHDDLGRAMAQMYAVDV